MKTVFLDVDTQIDFMYPAGALYVSGAEAIVERIATLNRYAAVQGILVISTMDAHTENDPEFQIWPHHCVAGTTGQQKPACTLLEKRLVVPNSPCAEPIGRVQQVLLEKQKLDCFTNFNLLRLLEESGIERCVVYGVVTEICVKIAALGLLKTGRRVELVADAVRELSEEESKKTISEFTGLGGRLTSTFDIFKNADKPAEVRP